MTPTNLYIPNMYNALREEDPNMSPDDARDRIQKDCVGIWSTRTILDALPSEAKDPKKQKAGRLSRTEQRSAAFSAAQQMRKEIQINTMENALQQMSIKPIIIQSQISAGGEGTFKDYGIMTR